MHLKKRQAISKKPDDEKTTAGIGMKPSTKDLTKGSGLRLMWKISSHKDVPLNFFCGCRQIFQYHLG
jgi:hypothetical protein